MARNSLLCADVPLRNYSLTHESKYIVSEHNVEPFFVTCDYKTDSNYLSPVSIIPVIAGRQHGPSRQLG